MRGGRDGWRASGLYGRLHARDRTLVLVRPDGYLGIRCQPTDAMALSRGTSAAPSFPRDRTEPRIEVEHVTREPPR